MCQCFNILAVHGHGRGTHLGTCLVCAAFVVFFVACINDYEFSILYLIFITLLVYGHGRCKRLGTCLVLELHASCVMSLQHVPMFEYAGCARLKILVAHILNMLVAHGHGRGTHLGTCLV